MPTEKRPAFARFDPSLRFVSVNDALPKALGVKRSELIGRGVLDVYPAGEGTTLHLLILEAMATMRAVKQPAYSNRMRTWIAVEIYPLSGSVEVVFRRMDPPAGASAAVRP